MLSIKCNNISFSYTKELTVLKNVDLEILQGSFNIITGSNGTGKSTLMNIMSKKMAPSSGTIICNDKIFFMEQFPDINKNFPISVLQFVLLGRITNLTFCFNKQDIKDAEHCLKTLNILDLKDKNIDKLSGGQEKKILLARGIMSKAKIFLLDEPLCGIDAQSRVFVLHYIEKLSKIYNITIVMITHHNEHANLKITGKHFIMNNGKLNHVISPSKKEVCIKNEILNLCECER